MESVYACIDLKSFYASVECIERGLNPLTTNLVVADENRTEKTICLAVTPSLKAYGIPGRARLFEAIQKVKEANYYRRMKAPNRKFVGKSYDSEELKANPELELDFIKAPPRMAHYMKWSTQIYDTYLKYISPDDIYPYSIDEVFCDITKYLKTANMNPQEFVTQMIKDVYETTGITATAGIGTNMYLAKIAMDIVAKHAEPNQFGVRIAQIDEMSYRKLLWNHRPLTDFWRVGKGYAKKLEQNRIYTMGDIARCSINNEDLLYKLFGVNAELLIDHAWGWEPCTMKHIKEYKPSTNSICSGQVLHCPYDFQKTKLIVKEMTDALVLNLVKKHVVTDQIVLTIGYDVENLINADISSNYSGEITIDRYGRKIPKHAHGTVNLKSKTSSTKEIMEAVMSLYDRIADKNLLIRRINISANKIVDISNVNKKDSYEQLDMFTNYEGLAKEEEINRKKKEKENNLQKVVLDIKNKYGKNAILKGMNFEEAGTMRERNGQIGGHKC